MAKLLSEDERQELIEVLAKNPTAGHPVPGTNGVRKLRFAAKGEGESSGARVIYDLYDETLPLYALMAYGKGEKDNARKNPAIAETSLGHERNPDGVKSMRRSQPWREAGVCRHVGAQFCNRLSGPHHSCRPSPGLVAAIRGTMV